MQSSVAECKTVDEQKQIILLATPVITQERFAQRTGLTEGRASVTRPFGLGSLRESS